VERKKTESPWWIAEELLQLYTEVLCAVFQVLFAQRKERHF